MVLRSTAAICMSVALAACATAAKAPTPLPGPIKCTAGPDCDAKWSRAVSWVASNSSYRIAIQTDSMIQTMGPIKDDSALAYTITKSAIDPKTYQILASDRCGDSFQCSTPPVDALWRFTQFVAGSQEGPVAKGVPQGQ
jgi:hypothetical protein